ncbi:MAG TPA: histidine triad nucleotide-binding protein [Candidatus Hydrogenedentes bacterium]|nr:histidine triad nucleotide-binding protein [Candidatus Hydrogenedentota bacterium]HNT86390.1 histidine triad nucleotide-binding protein [Candidatus Hydrogenedentota bacterium]
MAEDCLFCKIVRGDISAQKVYEDDDVLAFRDINPEAPTHVLLIPKRHLPRVTDATAEDAVLLGKMLLGANAVAEREGIAANGVRYVFNTNQDAGQIIFHAHMHILGGRPMGWPPG